jgi:hypothetical protein
MKSAIIIKNNEKPQPETNETPPEPGLAYDVSMITDNRVPMITSKVIFYHDIYTNTSII